MQIGLLSQQKMARNGESEYLETREGEGGEEQNKIINDKKIKREKEKS